MSGSSSESEVAPVIKQVKSIHQIEKEQDEERRRVLKLKDTLIQNEGQRLVQQLAQVKSSTQPPTPVIFRPKTPPIILTQPQIIPSPMRQSQHSVESIPEELSVTSSLIESHLNNQQYDQGTFEPLINMANNNEGRNSVAYNQRSSNLFDMPRNRNLMNDNPVVPRGVYRDDSLFVQNRESI